MKTIALLSLLAACQGAGGGPARALEEYRAGRALLEQGEPLRAAERFETATDHDPDHAVLRSWHAWALAQGGKPDEAIATLEQAPAGTLLPQDLFNLGAWNARQGRSVEAMAWLERAVAADPSLRTQVLVDPDLAGLRADLAASPAVGAEPPRAVMLGEEGAILAGESYDLELVAEGLGERAVTLAWEQPLPAGLALTRAVDGLFGSPDGGGPARHVAFRLRAGGAGEGDLGPWTLRVGEAALAIPAVPWQAVLPAGVELPAPPDPVAVDEVWWTPREALAGMVAPAAEWRSGRLAVVFSAGDEVATEPALPADGLLEIELRRDDQAEVLARAWPLDPAVRVVRVRVSRGGKVLLDRNVRRGR